VTATPRPSSTPDTATGSLVAIVTNGTAIVVCADALNGLRETC